MRWGLVTSAVEMAAHRAREVGYVITNLHASSVAHAAANAAFAATHHDLARIRHRVELVAAFTTRRAHYQLVQIVEALYD